MSRSGTRAGPGGRGRSRARYGAPEGRAGTVSATFDARRKGHSPARPSPPKGTAWRPRRCPRRRIRSRTCFRIRCCLGRPRDPLPPGPGSASARAGRARRATASAASADAAGARDMIRALFTLVGLAAAAALLLLVPDTGSAEGGGLWGRAALLAAAGLVAGAAYQLGGIRRPGVRLNLPMLDRRRASRGRCSRARSAPIARARRCGSATSCTTWSRTARSRAGRRRSRCWRSPRACCSHSRSSSRSWVSPRAPAQPKSMRPRKSSRPRGRSPCRTPPEPEPEPVDVRS